MKLVVDAGHEVGLHGYSHENPVAHDAAAGGRRPRQVDRARRQPITVNYPRGYVAPWWELSPATVDLLVKKKDQVRPQPDAQRFPRRTTCAPATRWTKIDYSKPAAHWMKPLQRGRLDRPRRDRRQLVPGRPAADDVHQGGAEQPRLRQSARMSRRSGATSSTGSTARWTTPRSRWRSTRTSPVGRRCC